jgi:hypothetical protein
MARDILGPDWVRNAGMARALQLIPEPAEVDVPEWLQALLSAGLLERDGCLFLAAAAPPLGASVPEQMHDRTGWETFINHFHVDPTDDTFADLAVAAAAALELVRQIEQLNPPRSARVIVSRNLQGEFPNSTVRFHRLRPGETWLAADLEGYRNEAVAYLDTPHRSAEA